MRSDNSAFSAATHSLSKSMRFVIELSFDEAHTDLVYITSHADCLTPVGATVISSVLNNVSGSSQRLVPDEGRAEIGTITFDADDIGGALSTLFRTKEIAGYGLRGKRVRLYIGEESLTAWSDYILAQTQIVDPKGVRAMDKGVYKFRCSDIQRSLRKNIFDTIKTNITSTVNPDDSTINVVSTSAYEMFAHDSSYTDSPNATVGYIKIGDTVIRYTGKTATTFTGCVHGVLGTKKGSYEITAGASQDRQPEVKEHKYLQGPAAKVLLGIITGSAYGQPGVTLPSGWHLGIAAEYVNTSEFTAIGTDLWDPSDPTLGYQLYFSGLEKQDGKKFCETQICMPMGAFMPISATGALGLRRMASIIAGASPVAVLDESVVIGLPTLNHDDGSVHNTYSIKWNWDEAQEQFTRTTTLIDQGSATPYGDADPIEWEFRGLHGSRCTDELLEQRLRSLCDRYAGPPLRMSLNLLHSQNALEVGDTVRVVLANVNDASANGAASLDRSMEIQQISYDWNKGVRVDLFGSTRRSSASAINLASYVVPDAHYATKGTDLSTYGGVTISLVSGVYHITGGTGLAAGVYHFTLGPLELDAGVTLPISGDVQIWCNYFVQINGTFSGAGAGPAGIAAGGSTTGTVGAYGTTQSEGGITLYFGLASATWSHACTSSGTAKSPNAVLPPVGIRYDGSVVTGIPASLAGTSGGAGGHVYNDYTATVLAAGGAGGAAGASLVIVSRGGAFGASGMVDVSGADGSLGATTAFGSLTLSAGAGAGGSAGIFLWAMDGNFSSPDLTGHVTATHGNSPVRATDYRISAKGSPTSYAAQTADTLVSYFAGFSSADASLANSSVVYISGDETAAEDVPAYTSDPTFTSDNVTVVNNVPPTPKGNLCTIEAGVTAPSDGNYSYTNIYARATGQTGYTLMGATAPEATMTVTADGTTYELQARSVSKTGYESPSGPTATITVHNLTTPVVITDTAPSAILTVPSVTGLELFEQGNNAEFIGRDAKATWRRVTASQWYELGAAPTGLGEGASRQDSYFRDYRVRVYDGSTNLLREEFVTDNWYVYSLEKNIEDYTRVNGTFGANRTFTVDVVVRCNHTTAVSAVPAKLTVANPAPGLGTAVSMTALTQSLLFAATPPTDHDLSGLVIWYSTSTGFALSASTILYDSAPTATVSPGGLKGGTTYYVRYAYRDAFADGTAYHDGTGLNVSGEYVVTTIKADAASEIAGLGNWATRITAADSAFISANVGNDAISSTQVAGIVAGKIQTGTMASRVAVSGVFSATGTSSALNETGLSAGTWRLDMGPVTDGGVTYIERFHNGSGTKNFWITDAGSAGFTGAITISGASSGYANFSDKPTALSGINSTEGTKLSGIATGADVTSTAITNSVTLSSGALNFQSAGVTTLSVDGTNKKLWINSGTFGNSGIQLDYNAGTPRFYVGNGTTQYLQYTGGAFTYSGSLSGATGTFSGSLSAATGTFAGSLSAATGSFSGTVTASTLIDSTYSLPGVYVKQVKYSVSTQTGTLTISVGTFASGGILNAKVNYIDYSVTPPLMKECPGFYTASLWSLYKDSGASTYNVKFEATNFKNNVLNRNDVDLYISLFINSNETQGWSGT